MSLLEYVITKKGRVDDTTFQLNFDANDEDEMYKVERIRDSTI